MAEKREFKVATGDLGARKFIEMSRFFLFLILTITAHAQSIRLPLGGGLEAELIRIAPTKFSQGESADGQREVALTKPFFMGKFPVTRGQFARFVAATNYRTEAEKGVSGGFGWEGGKLVQKKEYTWRSPGFPQTDEHPVVMVDFTDAKAFCVWLSRQAGRVVTLPTEAQWEYAARGAGSAGEAWHAGNSPGGTQPVSQAVANGFGLHDMLGNAWEWCEDWFAPYPPGVGTDPLQKNPNLSDKPRRVLRGGAFSRPAAEATAAKRFRNDPGSRNADNGIRVVAYEVPVPVVAPVVAPVAPARVELENPQPATRQVIPGELPMPAQPAHAFEYETQPEPVTRTTGLFSPWMIVGLVVVWLVVRRALKSGGSAAPLPQRNPAVQQRMAPGQMFSTRIVQDGFWIQGRVSPGTPLNVRWLGGASTHSRTFEYRPASEGHFVFTGNEPSNVVVSVGEDTGGGGGGLGMGMPLDDLPLLPRTSPSPTSRPSTFTGFPTAY